MKIGVMFGNPETTTGGNALKFYASVRIDIRSIGKIKDKEDIIGSQTRVKIVKNKENEIFVDSTFKANGRGAYLCNNLECFDKCIKSKALSRTFKGEIKPEVIETIKQYIKK